jgi:hypothetical protein
VPQPEGTVRVVLSDDYYLGEQWHDWDARTRYWPREVHDIPVEQAQRWCEARAAYERMQEEIHDLLFPGLT